MSLIREIRPDVYWVGAIDWDRRLFDGLIPLPDGTSYNAYVVKGSEKTVLLDAVDPPMKDVLLENLEALGLEKIDYVISHHAEQDHSGALGDVLNRYPEASILASAKGKELIAEFNLVPEGRISAVADGQELTLGSRTLLFINAPWVHWPDTFFTYLKEERIIFTCDFLGSHLAGSDLFVEDEAAIYEPAKRYYAEIMMPFRSSIKRHLERLKDLPIAIVAPSHGPLHKNPRFILDAYRDWSSDEVKNQVVIPFTSMHGSTRRMVDYFTEALISRGVGVKRFDLTGSDPGKLAMALVDAATLVVGSSTVLTGPHPNVVFAAVLANALRPKTRVASIIGSYGWGSKMVQDIQALIPNLKVELLEPVIARGYPSEEDLKALDRLADQISARHREMKILGS
ncbi:MAG: FprA family A-type flavoprotein [Methanosarcinales archaeon]|nr:FprA family A-type flavoprotein [Methanosarcinales archaeon]